MGKFRIENNVLMEYEGQEKVIEVPKEVEVIGAQAFAWNEHLTEVSFKGKIVKVGREAFLQCENLKKIELPPNILIEDNAFTNCFLLEKICSENPYVMGETGADAFSFCEELSNDIKIAEGTEVLRQGVFSGCYNIDKVWIPDSLKEINEVGLENIGQFICNNNADIYIQLMDMGYECEIRGKKGKLLAEQIEADTTLCLTCGKRIGAWEKNCIYCGAENGLYVSDKEWKKLKKMLEKQGRKQVPKWESIFPETPYTVEQQWLYGIHPNDETFKELLRLEVIRKFSKR